MPFVFCVYRFAYGLPRNAEGARYLVLAYAIVRRFPPDSRSLLPRLARG